MASPFLLRLSFLSSLLTGIALLVPPTSPCFAADAPTAEKKGDEVAVDKKNEKPGDWLVLPSDGTPWTHEGTGLRYPQIMGSFRLRLGFRDKRDEAGIAISYVHESKNIKGDVVIFPCPKDLNKEKDVMAYLRGEHEKLVKELKAVSKELGYAELSHTEVEERAVNLWEGNLPLTVQSFEFGPSINNDELTKPNTSQWFGLALYQDHFVQMSIVRPSVSGKEGEGLRDELVRLFLQCIREPSVTPEMLKLCRSYVKDPLTKEGRGAADALFQYSKASPVFKIVFPGEVLTPAIETAAKADKESASDLLRAFIVGSGVVALQNGTADQSLEEGSRIMGHVYEELKKQNAQVKSELMEELLPEVAKQRAAMFLREKMAKESADK
ncbi:MAG: hypothetical protein JWO08_3743 [Verrucomicrobiaceae bacterium]|nr:hypothetical protein [Verrucomicrobiaceae bacterium]